MQNAPELRLGLQLFMVAFTDLSSSRPSGFGVAPIPWTAINSYCDVLGLEGEQREDVHHHVRELDETYMKWHNDKKS